MPDSETGGRDTRSDLAADGGASRTAERSPTRQDYRSVAIHLAWVIGKYAFLVMVAALALFPIMLIVSTAFKTRADVLTDPFGLFSSFTIDSIVSAWTLGGFSRYFVNTLIVTIPTVIGTIALSTAAGYAFARCEFPGSRPLFYIVLLGLMIPFFAIMIPLYFQLRQMGLLNSYWAIILPLIAGANGTGASGGLSFGIFMMRAFFSTIPEDFAHAARVDGCSEFQIFLRIMAPLVRPAATTLAIFSFLQSWNTFLLPLVFAPGTERRMLSTGLYLFASGRVTEVDLVAAAALIMSLPVMIVFMLAQRQLIRGFTSGGIRG